MAKRNPPWTRDELILALDLYFKVNPAHISSSHPDVIRLSEVLNELPIHKVRPDSEKFRNPNSVYMKLCNFLRLDPTYHGAGLSRGSKMDIAIWDEFGNDPEQLNASVKEILDKTK
ncbi:MAG: restriction endonuclease [Chloroflexi bacterium]|nr:restriction endonuclease [Chloroflexota bacterium]